MSFFDDVASFFGGGEAQDAGPITVPLPAMHDDDPGVQAAQARYSEACQREDELKALEPDVRAKAEAARDMDQQAQHEAVQQQYDALRAKADQLRHSYDPLAGAKNVDNAEEYQAACKQMANLELKLRQLESPSIFRGHNPLEKYMDQKFVMEQKAAEAARFQAQVALEQARQAARSKAAR